MFDKDFLDFTNRRYENFCPNNNFSTDKIAHIDLRIIKRQCLMESETLEKEWGPLMS